MNKRKVGITVVVTVFAVCALALALLVLGPFIAEHTAVPFQNMWVWFEDEDSVAAIHSDAFQVSFAGHSFGSHSRSGNYLVDGRYGFRLFGGAESASGEVGGGVTWDYSQRRRLAKFRYQGHEIAYCHALKKLTVDGQKYSTAGGQVRLLIKENGEVERVDK